MAIPRPTNCGCSSTVVRRRPSHAPRAGGAKYSAGRSGGLGGAQRSKHDRVLLPPRRDSARRRDERRGHVRIGGEQVRQPFGLLAHHRHGQRPRLLEPGERLVVDRQRVAARVDPARASPGRRRDRARTTCRRVSPAAMSNRRSSSDAVAARQRDADLLRRPEVGDLEIGLARGRTAERGTDVERGDRRRCPPLRTRNARATAGVARPRRSRRR